MTKYQKLAAAFLIALAYVVVAVLVLREASESKPNFTLCPLCGE